MQLKLCLILGFTVLGSLIGYRLYKKDKEKENYFSALKSLANSLICDIKFAKTEIGELIKNFQNNNELFVLHKNQYLDGLNSGKIDFDKKWLKNEQYYVVSNFFYNLGRYDTETQIYQIEGAKEKINDYLMESAEKNKRFNKMKIKLGFMFGLAAGILIL